MGYGHGGGGRGQRRKVEWQALSKLEGKTAGDSGRLRAALHRARQDQADYFDAVEEVRLAETARLQVLADALQTVMAELPDGNDHIHCVVVPGNPPRLWIDILAYVAIADDGRTYRLMRTSEAGRRTLFESPDRDEMAARITDYIAHRIVDRDREAERAFVAAHSAGGSYTGTALLLAWICGFSVGILALFVIGVIVAGGAMAP